MKPPLITTRLLAISCAVVVGLTVAPLHAQQQIPPGASALPPRPLPAVGRPYGELVLPNLDGSRTVSLDVYRGRKVLLIEFASW